jgi:hypothetical protein
MNPPPIVLGLAICEKVIVEEGTKNVTLVSTFTKLIIEEFPSPPQRFAVYIVLTEGIGDAKMKMLITSLENDEVIHTDEFTVRFPNRLMEVRVLFRVARCSFPRAGKYQVTLFLDDDWLAERQIQLAERQA